MSMVLHWLVAYRDRKIDETASIQDKRAGSARICLYRFEHADVGLFVGCKEKLGPNHRRIAMVVRRRGQSREGPAVGECAGTRRGVEDTDVIGVPRREVGLGADGGGAEVLHPGARTRREGGLGEGVGGGVEREDVALDSRCHDDLCADRDGPRVMVVVAADSSGELAEGVGGEVELANLVAFVRHKINLAGKRGLRDTAGSIHI